MSRVLTTLIDAARRATSSTSPSSSVAALRVTFLASEGQWDNLYSNLGLCYVEKSATAGSSRMGGTRVPTTHWACNRLSPAKCFGGGKPAAEEHAGRTDRIRRQAFQYQSERAYQQQVPIVRKKAVQVAQPGHRGMLAAGSPGVIADPWKETPKLSWMEWAASWLSPTGWRAVKDYWWDFGKDTYTLARVSRAVPGWSMSGFRTLAFQLYEDVNNAFATMDTRAISALTTPKVGSQMLAEIQRRKKAGWKAMTWEMVEGERKVSLLRARLIGRDYTDDNTCWVQMTLRYSSMQRFAVRSKDGDVLVGSEDEPVHIQDTWVLERPLKGGTAARWRLAMRLPSAVAGQLQPQMQGTAASPQQPA